MGMGGWDCNEEKNRMKTKTERREKVKVNIHNVTSKKQPPPGAVGYLFLILGCAETG